MTQHPVLGGSLIINYDNDNNNDDNNNDNNNNDNNNDDNNNNNNKWSHQQNGAPRAPLLQAPVVSLETMSYYVRFSMLW